MPHSDARQQTNMNDASVELQNVEATGNHWTAHQEEVRLQVLQEVHEDGRLYLQSEQRQVHRASFIFVANCILTGLSVLIF